MLHVFSSVMATGGGGVPASGDEPETPASGFSFADAGSSRTSMATPPQPQSTEPTNEKQKTALRLPIKRAQEQRACQANRSCVRAPLRLLLLGFVEPRAPRFVLRAERRQRIDIGSASRVQN